MKKICEVKSCDSSYPHLLNYIADPPQRLRILGSLPDFEEFPPIAIVGSRKPTDYGLEMAEKISSELTRAGFSIISGLAYGIDIAAHKACVKCGGKSVAVLGSGLNVIYPAIHKKVAGEIIALGGGIVSEFDDEAKPLQYNFPKRNRIISGMSYAVVVVEAAIDSGSLITANVAAQQNRDVFAVPGLAGHVNSSGTNMLIKNGAHLVESAQDIVEVIQNRMPMKWKTNFSGKSSNVGDKEATLLNWLGKKPVSVDELVAKSGLTSSEVLMRLTLLEAHGLATSRDGTNFLRIKTND